MATKFVGFNAWVLIKQAASGTAMQANVGLCRASSFEIV